MWPSRSLVCQRGRRAAKSPLFSTVVRCRRQPFLSISTCHVSWVNLNHRWLSAQAGLSASTALCPSDVRRQGTIESWDFLGRRGIILDDETGERVHISNPCAFETVLPTHLRGGLQGARVSFCVSSSHLSSKRVLTRVRTDRLTSKSYQQKPPVDFIALAARTPVITGLEEQPELCSAPPSPTGATNREDETLSHRYAEKIVLEIDSLSPAQLLHCDGPLVAASSAVGGRTEAELLDGDSVAPPMHLKDMRGSKLFDRATQERLRLCKALGSMEAAERFIEERERRQLLEQQCSGRAKPREVVKEGATGKVEMWSALHRSGLIREETTSPATEAGLVASTGEAGDVLIRNAQCFDTALPSSRDLVGRVVRFDKVVYAAQPNKFYAENIKLVEDRDFEPPRASLEAALPRVQIPSWDPVRPAAGEAGEAGEAVVHTAYGVITRWSGGSGILHSSDGKQFVVSSASHFNQLVDFASRKLRGAVVRFQWSTAQPTVAQSIDILCVSEGDPSEWKPALNIQPAAASASANEPPAATATPPAEREEVLRATPEGAWTFGILVSWSPCEGHGIVQDRDDPANRYLLRNVEQNVIGWSDVSEEGAEKEQESTVIQRTPPQRVVKWLKVGRHLKFMTYGSTGKFVCNAVLLESVSEAEESGGYQLRLPDQAEKEVEQQVDQEAIVSPTCTSYWLQRMERVGFDVKEVSDLQNKALLPPNDDDDDGGFLDSEDLLKKDPWWNDPKKNRRLPNSQVTHGHLALIGPASMMNIAAKASDPKRLDKMLKKYQARLTEEQKEMAWQKATEMAPKYEECIRQAKAKNEEPTFYFF